MIVNYLIIYVTSVIIKYVYHQHWIVITNMFYFETRIIYSWYINIHSLFCKSIVIFHSVWHVYPIQYPGEGAVVYSRDTREFHGNILNIMTGDKGNLNMGDQSKGAYHE